MPGAVVPQGVGAEAAGALLAAAAKGGLCHRGQLLLVAGGAHEGHLQQQQQQQRTVLPHMAAQGLGHAAWLLAMLCAILSAGPVAGPNAMVSR
jgi:hypothetical protein